MYANYETILNFRQSSLCTLFLSQISAEVVSVGAIIQDHISSRCTMKLQKPSYNTIFIFTTMYVKRRFGELLEQYQNSHDNSKPKTLNALTANIVMDKSDVTEMLNLVLNLQ